MAVAVVLVLALVAAGVGGFVVLSQDDDDGEVAADRDDASSTTTTQSGEVSPPAEDEGSPSGDTPPGFVDFSDEEGGFQLAIPEDWGAAAIHDGDASGIGDEAFPDDPSLAAQFEQTAGDLPAPIVFFAVDPAVANATGFPTNANIVSQASAVEPSQEELAQAARDAVDLVPEAELVDEGEVTTGLGDGARVDYEIADIGARGVQYYLYGDGTVWILTFTTTAADLAGNEALFEQMATSFGTL